MCILYTMAETYIANWFHINRGLQNHGVKINYIFDHEVFETTLDFYFGSKTRKNEWHYHNNFFWCCAPFHEERLQHHGHNGTPKWCLGLVTSVIGERAQVVLVWVRGPHIENASHPRRLGFTKTMSSIPMDSNDLGVACKTANVRTTITLHYLSKWGKWGVYWHLRKE